MRLPDGLALIAVLAQSIVAVQATTTQDGVQAFLRADYEAAIRILTPFAEDAQNPDPIAQFFLAAMYDSGRGAARNPFRACGFYMSAASVPHLLTRQARDIAEGIREPFASGRGRDEACSTAATISSSPIPPATLMIDVGNRVRSVASDAQTRTADAVSALLRRDYARAVQILKPLAETPWQPDHMAEFFMAVLYENGLGVAPDPMRGCALFLRAAIDRSPLGVAAMALARARQRTLGREAFATCDRRASFGFDDRFEPVTFALDQEHWIAWDLNGATISYRGIERRVGLGLTDRHVRFVSIRHAALASAKTSTPRHFVDVFRWMPAQPRTWALSWRLFEVVRDELISVAAQELVTTTGDEPPTAAEIDLSELVSLQVNADGDPEYAIRSGAASRTSVIESDAERQEWKRYAAQESQPSQSVPAGGRARIFDVHRQPGLAYVDAKGCGNVFVYGWTGDRAEVVAVRADNGVLQITAGGGTFDLATQTAGLEVSLHVYDQAMSSFPFCSDMGISRLVEEVWRPTRGTVTIQLMPTPFPVRAPSLHPATVRITGAQFVSPSGVRIDQTAPIMLTAIVGAFFG
jgi:Sel1 repeat